MPTRRNPRWSSRLRCLADSTASYSVQDRRVPAAKADGADKPAGLYELVAPRSFTKDHSSSDRSTFEDDNVSSLSVVEKRDVRRVEIGGKKGGYLEYMGATVLTEVRSENAKATGANARIEHAYNLMFFTNQSKIRVRNRLGSASA